MLETNSLTEKKTETVGLMKENDFKIYKLMERFESENFFQDLTSEIAELLKEHSKCFLLSVEFSDREWVELEKMSWKEIHDKFCGQKKGDNLLKRKRWGIDTRGRRYITKWLSCSCGFKLRKCEVFIKPSRRN